jgi:TonB-dependent SusC/RagA subfamily outer membrane receptor
MEDTTMSGITPVVAFCLLTITLGACGSKHRSAQRPTPTQSSAGLDSVSSDVATGAVTTVPGLSDSGPHYASVEEWLAGRVAGLQVVRLGSGEITLRIRGLQGMTEEGDALVVIDGMPVTPSNLTGVLRSINPDEVANIRILKDVSSTSAYGLKGAYGVVVITLKKRD